MAKNKIKKVVKIKDEESDMQYRNIIITFAILILLCIGLYYLTDNLKTKENATSDTEVEIKYNQILLSNTFSISAKEYYVLVYDYEEKFDTFYTELIETFRYGDQLYTSNLKDGMNKKYIGEKSNPKVQKLEDLMISGPTLIQIKEGKVVKYLEGEPKIKEELSDK